ncbi:MAG: hypothetical protein MOGMAGMI_02148 [Candidatus Omnitrophica bacterium]|nr:hypothetical protein [Candidatus Omnitrophota bacterium]
MFHYIILASLVLTAWTAAASELPEPRSWSALTDRRISERGQKAMDLIPEAERLHAETEHFVYHYSDADEAATVMTHAEVYYEWIRKSLGLETPPGARKIHVWVYTDQMVWDKLLALHGPPHSPGAFTDGDELFILRDPYWMSPMKTLAHEVAHVVLYRMIGPRVPLCLNEGFAEMISWRALAMQQGRSEFDLRVVRLVQPDRYIPLSELTGLQAYPEGERVKDFYTESELLVRYLLLERKTQGFQALLRRTAAGEPVLKVISDLLGEDEEVFRENFRRYATTGKTSATEADR